MEFRKIYYYAHLYLTLLTFFAFLFIALGIAEDYSSAQTVLGLMLTSFFLVILSVIQFRKNELDRFSVIYSILLSLLIIGLVGVMSLG